MPLTSLQLAIGEQDILGGGGSENVASRKVKQFNAFKKLRALLKDKKQVI